MIRHPRSIHHVAALAAAFALVAGTAWAKDSTKTSFTNPDPTDTAPFDDCVSSGQSKSGGSKVEYQLKKLVGLLDTDQLPCTGDEVICVATATVNLGGPTLNTEVVLFGEVKRSAVKIKHDICDEQPLACGTPADVPSYDTDARCFESDGGTFLASVVANPAFPFPLDPTCNRIGFGMLSYVYPSSPLIARDGMTNCYNP